MQKKLFLIGCLSGLSPGIQATIRARQVSRLEEADIAVAICPADGVWLDRSWDLLRQAHQDHLLPIRGTLAVNGTGGRPPRPWPGSRWVFHRKQAGVAWFRLQAEPHGYDPGDAVILFPESKHRGKTLRDCPVGYLDWLLGQDWFEPASFLHRMIRLYLGRLAKGALEGLDCEPFDTRGYVPSESWARIGLLTMRRPRAAVCAEDELINERLGRIVPRREGLERRDRDRVLMARVTDPETDRTRWTVRGTDNPARVHGWDRFLLALERIERAGDQEELQRQRGEALAWLKVVAQSEREAGTQFKEDIEEAARKRQAELAAREEAPDFQAARVTEAVRRMRGCRSIEELEEEADLIRLRKEDLTEQSLATLRRWFAHFRGGMTRENLRELLVKYGSEQRQEIASKR